MDVRSVEDWSKGARDAAVLDSRRQQQQSPSVLERGGEQLLEESRYEPGLTLVDSGSDPRAWLALVQPSGTCATHATSPDYLGHSPCSSTGSYQGETRRSCNQFWRFLTFFLSSITCNRQWLSKAVLQFILYCYNILIRLIKLKLKLYVSTYFTGSCQSGAKCLSNVFILQRAAPRCHRATPALPATENLPKAPPLLRSKSGTCAVLKARSPGPRRTHPPDREPRPADRSTASRSRGAWPPTLARGGGCTGWTTRSTSCAASSRRSTTTRSSPSTKLYRWRRFTSTLWLTCSRVRPHPAAALAAPAAAATPMSQSITRQRLTLCWQPPLVLMGRTELRPPRRPAGQPRPRPPQMAAYLSTSAGCLSAPLSTTPRFPPWSKRRCVRPRAARSQRPEEGGKSLPGATESSPRTPTSVTRMKLRWSSTPAKRTTCRTWSCAATTTTTTATSNTPCLSEWFQIYNRLDHSFTAASNKVM